MQPCNNKWSIEAHVAIKKIIKNMMTFCQVRIYLLSKAYSFKYIISVSSLSCHERIWPLILEIKWHCSWYLRTQTSWFQCLLKQFIHQKRNHIMKCYNNESDAFFKSLQKNIVFHLRFRNLVLVIELLSRL